MMKELNAKLHKLQEEISEKDHLQSMLRELNSEKQSLEWKVQELEAEKQKEELDVEKLEGRSLAVFFYNVIGKLDDKLTTERQEAYAAAVKYDAAVRELGAVKADIAKIKKEWSVFGDCEKEYQQILKEKEKILKASGTSEAEEIFHLESEIIALNGKEREIEEALAAGEECYSLIKDILSELDSAEGWGFGDMLGGGLLTDAMKYSHLDEAQGLIEQLQVKLRHFKTELADVAVYAELKVNIDDFTRFADYFFDGLFVDWAVMDEISKAKEQAEDTKIQINNVLCKLDSIKETTKNQKKQHQMQIETIIKNAGE